ncbi:unnamed protein product [Medioppia subpectinata]|uniref:Uncharacterized protein n=1 Tax=Medioppia subpectinata TaxID=1979941 RepID=A0A7R9LB24_9ACAR|nr:unnamed protein product [Medioppia subpectinata]CAG2117403.1 unnamed protein product [Medioppia subpectinata]
MGLTTERLLASGVLFLITLIVGTVPVYVFQWWNRRRSTRSVVITTNESHRTVLSSNFYVQLMTQIGGGILFFTVIAHMIPEIRENFDNYMASNQSFINCDNKSEFVKAIEPLKLPFLELSICLGFFAVYLAEVLMHSLLDIHDNDSNLKEEVYDFDKKSQISSIESEPNSSAPTVRDEDQPVLIAIRCHKSKCDISTHMHNVVKLEPLYIRLVHGLVIISAFSIHSIFDGISIGVKTTRPEIWTMFIAIASHKFMISLILGIEIYEKCHNFLLVVFQMILFSIMSPIGIITVILTENSYDINGEDNPFTIFLSAMASGTILYIVFFEILQKERATKLKPIVQFLAIFIGFGLMFLVTITIRED